MEQLSPFTRKVVAIGLLIVLLVSLINLGVMPLVTSLSDRLGQLQDARFRHARLEMLEAAAPPQSMASPRAALAFHGANAAQAQESLAATIRDSAVRSGATAEMGSPTVSGATLGATLVVMGPEQAVLNFINQLERGEPVIRFAAWKLSKASGTNGQLRLDARLLAAWAPAT